jgi:hypothetical protein
MSQTTNIQRFKKQAPILKMLYLRKYTHGAGGREGKLLSIKNWRHHQFRGKYFARNAGGGEIDKLRAFILS